MTTEDEEYAIEPTDEEIERDHQMIKDANRVFTCELCENDFPGIGHKLTRGGYCCDGCNETKVLPLRMRGIHL